MQRNFLFFKSLCNTVPIRTNLTESKPQLNHWFTLGLLGVYYIW